MEIIDKIVSSQYPPNDRNVIWENNGKLFKIINGKWKEISSGGGGSTISASVEQTDNGAIISITDNEGTTTATVDNGKTPIKGTDYWTESDKQEVIAEATAEIVNPIVYKGTLGVDGTITTLPTASESNHGWQYNVVTAGTYNGISANVGDSFVSNGASWGYYPTKTEILTPDEFDLTSGTDGKIRLKDRLPENGMGHNHIKSNIAYSTFKNQTENTCYRITENSDLSGWVPIKKECIVNFDGAIITPISGGRFVGEAPIENPSGRSMVRYRGISVVKNVGTMPFSCSSIDDDLGFYNVTKYGIENTGYIDVTTKLQELIDKIKIDAQQVGAGSSIPFGKRKAVIYFPPGYYLISDTIIPSYPNIVIKGDNRSSCILFKPTSQNKFAFGINTVSTTFSFSFDSICIVSDSYRVTRKKVSDVGQWWNGSNAQHYHYTTKDSNDNQCGILLRSYIKNCEISGFSGIGVVADSEFCRIENSSITNCYIGFSNNENPSSYTSDSLVDTTEIRYCGIGAKVKGWSYFRNCWLDEFIHNAVNGSGSLVLTGTHINHCDEAGICSNDQGLGWKIMGDFVINRTNCYYAGYTLENVPKDDIKRACAIYSNGALLINSCISISNQVMADNSDGDAQNSGKCCVIPIYCDHLVVESGSNLSIIGSTNTDIPILGSAEDDNLYITTAHGKWNVRLQKYETDIISGSTSNRPLLLENERGFQYFDTTLGKPIFWIGTKWVDSTGADA